MIDSIQNVISSLLVKDVISARRSLERLKKQFGDKALFSWFDGNISILENDIHKAKSLFYKTTSNEKETCLGAYSLCNIAVKNNDYLTEIDALKSMLNASNNSNKSVILLRLISICILNKTYEEIEEYVRELKSQKYDYWKRIAAIYNFCVAMDESRIHERKDRLEKAFGFCQEIPEIAIAYANELLANNSISKAKKVLLECWKLCPSKSLFNAYIYIVQDLDLENIFDNADKLIAANNKSWIGYFELGKLLLKDCRYEDAFYNLLTAYGKKHYTEIVECLKECASKLNDPKPISAQEVLDGDILCDDIHCAFICETCGCVLNEWTPICNKCQSIDSYIHRELNGNDAPTNIRYLGF